ncbi:MAG: 3-deoxy-7-phosphoheptulonate synthase, partial [Sphingomonadales bacterium]
MKRTNQAMPQNWSPTTWRDKPTLQMPVYSDGEALGNVEAQLRNYPPLVFAGEARRLTKQLGDVAEGRAFLL